MIATVDAARIRAEVRELQKASAVLACIQFAAEYDNEREVDLADAVALVSAASARIDASLLKDEKADMRGRRAALKAVNDQTASAFCRSRFDSE